MIILFYRDFKIKSPKETGKSFISNSKLKANYFSKFVNYPVLSDDSGLCIKALNNKPGIHSARLAKKHGNFFKAMKHILQQLKKKKNRTATFVCSLTYKNKNKKIISVEGKIKGHISKKIIVSFPNRLILQQKLRMKLSIIPILSKI